MPSDPRGDEAGFTIIEVLVALAVVAVALAAIGAVAATSIRGTRTLEQHVALVQSARAIVTGLPKRAELAIGQMSGDYAGHRWRLDVAPFIGAAAETSATSPWEPRSVVVTVRSPSGGLLQVETVRLQRRAGG
jgi:general secretion pathway protein I